MCLTRKRSAAQNLLALLTIILFSCAHKDQFALPDHGKLAKEYYEEDARWYLDNIPFFECSDKQIEQVYYYRWKLYKAHIRHVGENSYVITEFINHVPWDREPYCTINAASMHHIYEGRWLRDGRYMDGYINYLYQEGGNNRRYSESIADAAYARYLVNADSAFIVKQLDSMQRMYREWSDHYDQGKNLYYIPAMPDATEYTIASIDASGGKDGFNDGEAYRPTINSYMYGNAMAIAHIAAMKGDAELTKEYLVKAAWLKADVQHSLWNDSLKHFTDRFKVSNQYVRHWDFIRGRELAGLIPWYFNLPEDNQTYNEAWKHIIDTTQLLGKFGLRTNEPSYQYYFKQFVFFEGQRGSQWNGPSWPYQTSQVITAMANFLNHYNQKIITASDYLKILRLYTQQHYLPNGKINLVENYDPNLGGPIVFYYWSNHYNHSSYNNLIITGLCGIRPSGSDTLVLNPLIDNSIDYFCLDDVLYHGHKLTIVYDRDGTRYKVGKGLSALVDGKKAELLKIGDKQAIIVGPTIIEHSRQEQPNHALNIWRKDYPMPSGSVNTLPDTSLYQAIDGKTWYFPEITNRWTTLGSIAKTDWFSIDFGQPREISMIKIYAVADNETFLAPDSFTIEFQYGNKWIQVPIKEQRPAKPVGNTETTLSFDKITTTRIRINFAHAQKQVAISEIECY
jgi:Mannosylglycerate hydrolase MGH1-like glycoside hydrolase domain/NedA-like, galactose-binding domain/Glycosyl hydrolase family 65, C-terminal domain